MDIARTTHKYGSSRAKPKAGGADISDQIAMLNREMMGLPLEKRRSTWKEYYQRLAQLAGQESPSLRESWRAPIVRS
jgi:hypothetical protein